MRMRPQEIAMRRLISQFILDVRATTSIEYAVIAVGISIVIIGAVTTLGTNLSAKYDQVKAAIN
jgi:pilus assembly protein Flp/PilA